MTVESNRFSCHSWLVHMISWQSSVINSERNQTCQLMMKFSSLLEVGNLMQQHQSFHLDMLCNVYSCNISLPF